jgi:hypothetical protein
VLVTAIQVRVLASALFDGLRENCMNKICLIVIAMGLTACSTGVVQVDKDTYMVSEKAAGCGFATAGGQEADAYKKANKYCSSRNLDVEVVSTTAKEGVPFARCASANVKFKCVSRRADKASL